MSTSLIPILGSGTSSSQRPGLASFFTSACIVSIAISPRVAGLHAEPPRPGRPAHRRNSSPLKANFFGLELAMPKAWLVNGERSRYYPKRHPIDRRRPSPVSAMIGGRNESRSPLVGMIPGSHYGSLKDEFKDFMMGSLSRTENLERLRDQAVWDVVVIGGGATGLGSAVDAAARGYRTLLLESHDFAHGTSSRSTKLIHGGVRYLAQGNVAAGARGTRGARLLASKRTSACSPARLRGARVSLARAAVLWNRAQAL